MLTKNYLLQRNSLTSNSGKYYSFNNQTKKKKGVVHANTDTGNDLVAFRAHISTGLPKLIPLATNMCIHCI